MAGARGVSLGVARPSNRKVPHAEGTLSRSKRVGNFFYRREAGQSRAATAVLSGEGLLLILAGERFFANFK